MTIHRAAWLLLCHRSQLHQVPMGKLSLGCPRSHAWTDILLAGQALRCDKRYNQRSFSSSRIVNQSKEEQDKLKEKVQAQANASPPIEQESRLEIDTKHGKLLVKTTLADSKLQEIIIEKPKTDTTLKEATTSATAKREDLPKQSLLAEEDARVRAEADLKEQLAEKNRQLAKKRIRVDFSRSSLERNFITPVRAMSDFLLKPSDLEALAKTKRRSPYEQEPPITVYWRKDVEAKAIEVWGSRENLLKECLKREIEKKMHQQNIFTVKRRLRDYRREIGSRTNVVDSEPGLFGKSGKVVLTAIAINATNCLFKFGAWLYTGSHSMFAETIHSLADTINQLILAYGIHKSTQIADSDHPYGYSNMKYVSSLISGVGIFCVGTGLSFYHGIMGLVDPHPIDDFFWAFFILGGSLVSEGATLLVAINSCRSGAKALGMSFRDYVARGQDPCVNVVLTEDAAAVLSVALAATCMGLSTYTGSPIPDAVGSLLVGCMLGGVASFIIYTNVAALVGRSIRQENLDKINAELESDIMIRAIHDVKGIDMGNSLVRYKAEMDFDGRELTRVYLDKQDLNLLLEEVRTFQTIDELEAFLLKHGENIVDLMGGEIDRIEMKLRKKFPEIRHCDLEIL
ncbi:zinc transporter 9 [Anopheles marshallii]|uniref:zinc transporter 9 n=1 Tax=Anopheles marshallii TaxID=1521116 RepID=UPI00237AD10D|nr:zinc transporter 9 [Anopheles marshallii]